MEKKVKIVLAEGHTILREGLRALLSSGSNLEIVGDAEDGLKAVDCVEKLDISIKTVEKHRESLMRKLDLHNVAALTVFAMEKGLINRKI